MVAGMTRNNFTIDPSRLARYRSAADAARGESRAIQQRVTDARNRLTEAEAELRRIERARPGSPAGVIRVDADGRRHGRLESRHDEYVEQAQRRAKTARFELAQLAREQAEGAARREHEVQLFARIEAHVREVGR